MNIIVVGCGRVGSELAYRLYQNGHRVTVVDITASAFASLPPDFRGRTLEGEPLNQDLLRRAGIEQAEGIALVTSSDSVNAVVAQIAREVYGILNIVVRNYEPQWRSIYEIFNFQVVSSSSWGAQRLEELLYHVQMRSVFSAGNGEVEIYEFAIPAEWVDRPIKDILPNEDCIPVSLTRAGTALLPDRDIHFVEGDIALVSATLKGIEELRNRVSQSHS
jgi:trk system potassium uptake protein TrkA